MSGPLRSVTTCEGCGIQLAPSMLACPSCNRLVHKEALQTLAREATEAETVGDITESLQKWRDALELIPRNSKQFAIIADKVTKLGLQLPKSVVKPKTPHVDLSNGDLSNGDLSKGDLSKGNSRKSASVIASVGAFGLLVWKSKLLLAGLTKSSTLFTMLASLGVYWTIWGWKFALGLVLSIYVHEMGHMIELRRYGFRTGVPMFIPGLGALIRMKQNVVNARENADIGLAGPIYGLGAALVSLGLWQITALPIFAAIAGVGAWINLFNLLPFGSLDGGRAMQSMSRIEKIACMVCVGVAWYFTHESMLVLIFLVSVGQLFAQNHETTGYRKAAVLYCFLVFVLTAMSLTRTLVDETQLAASQRTMGIESRELMAKSR